MGLIESVPVDKFEHPRLAYAQQEEDLQLRRMRREVWRQARSQQTSGIINVIKHEPGQLHYKTFCHVDNELIIGLWDEATENTSTKQISHTPFMQILHFVLEVITLATKH